MHSSGPLRESWTKGSSGVRPVIHWAGLMGHEDMKAEDYTNVRMDSPLRGRKAWQFGYVDLLPCNQLCVTLAPPVSI